MRRAKTHGNDPQTNLLQRQYAVVYAPGMKRSRFPENCVRLVASQVEAIDQADTSQQQYPALVEGPSRSSEGFRLYYLIEWLGSD